MTLYYFLLTINIIFKKKLIMKYSQATTLSFKKCFYTLLLASFLGHHSLYGMQRESSSSKNLQEESQQPQEQQPQGLPITQHLPQHLKENEQKNLEDSAVALSPRRLAQQKRLEEFLRHHPSANNAFKDAIMGKRWIDIMSAFYDPSKEFLVDIGFYTPEEGEDIANTPYEVMLEKGEKDLKIKKEKESEELREKLKNKNFLTPELRRIDNNEEEFLEGRSYEGNVFFDMVENISSAPSLELLALFPKEAHHEKLNNHLAALKNYWYLCEPKDRPKDKKISKNFYENYQDYCQNSKDAFNAEYDTCNHFPKKKGQIAHRTLQRHKFYITYIKRIYEKLLGLLFDNVDLLDDFSYIVNTLDFEQERVSRLRKAMSNLLSQKDSLAFSLCALSFASFGDDRRDEFFSPYATMFYMPIIDGYISDIDLNISTQLECLDKDGQKFSKFLSFKNTVNFKDSQECVFQSFEKVNFSQGVSLITKKLEPSMCKKNFFCTKIIELELDRKNIWLLLEDYLNQHSSSKNYRLNLFKRVATLGLLMTNASPQDYTEFLNNILVRSYRKRKELFMKEELVEKVELCFAYDYFDNTISSPLWEQNEENITKAIKIFAQNTFGRLQASHILDDNDKNYYKKNLLTLNFGIGNKEEVMDDFITTRTLYFYTAFSDFCKKNKYDTSCLSGLIEGVKNTITLFNHVKKFHIQGLKQIIGSDIKSMRLLLTCFKKGEKEITGGGINEIFGRINAFHIQLFPFCSNYQTFCHILNHVSTINSQFFSVNKKNLSLEEVRDIIATELAVFYFSTYKTFSIHQGIISLDDHARSLKVDYVDPVFLHIKILCSEKLVPLLVQIGQCNKTIDFTLLEKSLTK